MSADLLAQFDSFYQAPTDKKAQNANPPAVNDLSFLGTTNAPNQYGTTTSQWQIPQTQSNDDIWSGVNNFQSSNARQPIQPQDDIWGSFETAEAENTRPGGQQKTGLEQTPVMAATNTEKMKPVMLRRDTLEMFSSSTIDSWGRSTVGKSDPPASTIPSKNPSTSTWQGSKGGDILFDADNLSADEDDDFGDFEGGPTEPPTIPQPVSPQTSTKSLEGLFGATSIQSKTTKRPAALSPIAQEFDHDNLPYPKAPKSPSFQERNPFADLGVATTQVSKLKSQTREGSPVTPWPSFEPPAPEPYQDSPVQRDDLDEDWGDFADMPPAKPTRKAPRIVKSVSGIEADAWAWDAADGISSSVPTAQDDLPPPTNVPPPSVLLPLFAALFDLPRSALFQPVANQPFSLKNRILSDPSTIDFLRAYLQIATVAAYIIAGRKLRWKRDNILSQAMKIGPAAAGGKGGMKLAGVDRAETTREDREAADLVRVWKDQVGRLKSAVAIANTSIQDVSKHLAIPEVSEVLHVKTQEGGLAAPKQCLICGLKRDERVAKVDINVEDSFGEWWSEHWGHRSCRNFWLEHQKELKQR